MEPSTDHNFRDLEKQDVRAYWEHEAQDFTPWLADELQADDTSHLDDVIGPELDVDEVVLERKYDFESDSPASGTQSFPRYQYETKDALSMGDAPPLIFQPRNN